MDSFDAIVVGGGAAGLSAALILGRSRRRVLLCDDGHPRNAVATAVHGFLSREGIDPRELVRIGREQAARYPSVEFANEHVQEAQRDGEGFVATVSTGRRYRARTLLIATGVYDELPDIEGLSSFWGRSAFVCPYCDGWEVAGKRIAAIGPPDRAAELAKELCQWSDQVSVCDQARVARIEGSRSPEVVMTDGSRERYDALFLTAPLRLRFPLVAMLGLRLRPDGEIEADECGRTSLTGCYAAGDAVTTAHQLVFAAASGVRAAMAINEDLMEIEDGKESAAVTTYQES